MLYIGQVLRNLIDLFQNQNGEGDTSNIEQKGANGDLRKKGKNNEISQNTTSSKSGNHKKQKSSTPCTLSAPPGTSIESGNKVSADRMCKLENNLELLSNNIL